MIWDRQNRLISMPKRPRIGLARLIRADRGSLFPIAC